MISLWLILCSLFACLSLYSFSQSEEPPTVLTLGDSISTGFRLEDPEGQCYAALVADALGMRWQDRAVASSTSWGVLKRLRDGSLDGIIADAKLILITCGGNDLMNAFYEMIAESYNADQNTDLDGNDIFKVFSGKVSSPSISDLAPYAMPLLSDYTEQTLFRSALAEYQENMFGSDGVLSYVRSQNRDAVILVASQYNPYTNAGGLLGVLGQLFQKGVQLLNDAISEAAKECGFYVSDVHSAFANSDRNLCNCYVSLKGVELDFHPTAEGHRLIAETVLESYRRAEVGIVGYQKSENGLRLVGYADSLSYGDFAVQIRYIDGNGEEKTVSHTVQTVYRRLYGTVNGERRTLVSTENEEPLAHHVPHGYLFVLPLLQDVMADSPICISIQAERGGLTAVSKEFSLTLGQPMT